MTSNSPGRIPRGIVTATGPCHVVAAMTSEPGRAPRGTNIAVSIMFGPAPTGTTMLCSRPSPRLKMNS